MSHLDDYQKASRSTWSLIKTDHPIVYPTLGLANEAGEVAGKIKKIFRDKGGVIGAAERETLKHELGDVLWFISACAPSRATWPSSTSRARKRKRSSSR